MTVIEKIQRDSLAMSVAQAVILANEAALGQGIDPVKALVTITGESSPPYRRWRVHYGPRDYVNQRGGDVTIFVDEAAAAVTKILRGQ
jgi:hypothetical protein